MSRDQILVLVDGRPELRDLEGLRPRTHGGEILSYTVGGQPVILSECQPAFDGQATVPLVLRVRCSNHGFHVRPAAGGAFEIVDYRASPFGGVTVFRASGPNAVDLIRAFADGAEAITRQPAPRPPPATIWQRIADLFRA